MRRIWREGSGVCRKSGTAAHYWVKWMISRKEVVVVGTDTSTLVDACHHYGTQGGKKKLNKNNISQTCTICLWVCCWHILHKSLHFWKRATIQKLHRPYRTIETLQQQWPWLTTSGRPRTISAASQPLISYTLLLYLTSKIVSVDVRWLFFIFFCFKRKKNVWNCGNPEMSCFFRSSNTDLAIVFFLTREIKLVIIYCHDVMMTMITYLLAVQGALLPAYVCMKGVWTEWRRMWWRWWQWYQECLCNCYNVECFFFILVHERFMIVCVCVCVLAFEHLSAPVREVNR